MRSQRWFSGICLHPITQWRRTQQEQEWHNVGSFWINIRLYKRSIENRLWETHVVFLSTRGKNGNPNLWLIWMKWSDLCKFKCHSELGETRANWANFIFERKKNHRTYFCFTGSIFQGQNSPFFNKYSPISFDVI